MKKSVVVGVKRAEVVSLHQDHDEPFRTFTTRVGSKAETFNFNTISECECGKKNFTSFTEEAIKDKMHVVVGDEDIKVSKTF